MNKSLTKKKKKMEKNSPDDTPQHEQPFRFESS